MTNKTKTPSAGAMRAAEAIESNPVIAVAVDGEPLSRASSIARIIDRETAVPELMAALEFYANRKNYETWWSASGARRPPKIPAFDDKGGRARDTLRKARGE